MDTCPVIWWSYTKLIWRPHIQLFGGHIPNYLVVTYPVIWWNLGAVGELSWGISPHIIVFIFPCTILAQLEPYMLDTGVVRNKIHNKLQTCMINSHTVFTQSTLIPYLLNIFRPRQARKGHSNMRKIHKFRSSCAYTMYYPNLCSPVSNNLLADREGPDQTARIAVRKCRKAFTHGEAHLS